MKSRNASGHKSGFTLVELLVVITIIALVIGIIVPALGGAKNLAKKQATAHTLAEINTAAAQYVNDRRVDPGYFSPREMGSVENATRGFCAAQNLMLSLLDPKGVAVTTAPGAGRIAVGPSAAKEVYVDLTLLGGASSGSYFAANARNFVAQDGAAGAGLQVASVAAHTQLPTLIDGWGNPVLAWAKDYQTTKPIGPSQFASPNDFAAIQYNVGSGSRFYLNANTAFTQSTQLGKTGANQTDDYKGSIFAVTAMNSAQIVQKSMGGLLGSPTSVLSADLTLLYDVIQPQDARGSLILQSAGTNGVYCGRKETGVKNAANILYFGLNFKDAAGNVNQASNGGNLIDVRDGLDDVFQLAGG